MLGKGKFSEVILATHKDSGTKVAIKIITKKGMTPEEEEFQRREIEVLKMVQH